MEGLTRTILPYSSFSSIENGKPQLRNSVQSEERLFLTIVLVLLHTGTYLHVLCNDHINEKHYHTQPAVKRWLDREALGVDSAAASHSDDKYFETFGLVGCQEIAT
jgi:hypothetical protein